MERDRTDRLLGEMERIAEAHRDVVVPAARGWVNLRPYFGEQHDSDMKWEPPLRRLFSARGPFVPQATWVPAFTKKRGDVPASIGLSHPRGPSAIKQLAQAGVLVPQDWVVRQDHSRRGIVIEAGPGAGCRGILEFMLDASEELSGVELPGRWKAEVIEV